MKYILPIIFVFLLIIVPASADNVTIEILQNSNDEYYISYDDELIACDNDTCVFDVDAYSVNTTEFELSNTDMKKISQYIALEIETMEYTEVVNESFITESNIVLRNELLESLYARTQNTFVPAIEERDALKTNLSEAQAMIEGLKADARGYDTLKKTHDDLTLILKNEIKKLEYLCGILTISFIAVLGFNSQSFKRIMELKRSKR